MEEKSRTNGAMCSTVPGKGAIKLELGEVGGHATMLVDARGGTSVTPVIMSITSMAMTPIVDHIRFTFDDPWISGRELGIALSPKPCMLRSFVGTT